MAHCPDFSSDEDGFSDDGDYYSFKERVKSVQTVNQISPKEQQIRNVQSALSSGNKELLIQELDNGLEVNEKVQGDWTPLLLAVSYGKYDLTQILIEKGADVNRDKDGCTPLMLACNVPETTSTFVETLAIIKLLLEKGADAKATNRKRMNALMFAANNGHLEAVKLLLPNCDKHAEDNQRWSALFWAVSGNHINVVKYLLEEGLNSLKKDVRSNTVLDLAKSNDLQEIVELFSSDEEDILAGILHAHAESNSLTNFQPGERPTFFLDIFNMLSGVKSEAVLKQVSENNLNLLEFIALTDQELEDIGVKLPYQRERILGGLYRLHKQPFHPKSLYVVPKDEIYSNIDVTLQLYSAIKQITAMQGSLKFMKKHFVGTAETNAELLTSLTTVQNRIKLLEYVSMRLLDKTKRWDSSLEPADLITPRSRKRRLPWRKICFLSSIGCLIIVGMIKIVK